MLALAYSKVIQIYVYMVYNFIGYYKILNTVLCAIMALLTSTIKMTSPQLDRKEVIKTD